VRIRQGEVSGALLRRFTCCTWTAQLAGWKIVVIVMWLPIAAVLIAIFRPALSPPCSKSRCSRWYLGRLPDPLDVPVADRPGRLLDHARGALFELYFALELLLSGRLVPLALLPDWAAGSPTSLPFRWTLASRSRRSPVSCRSRRC
jgi:ABC-2 type transport system permease protein